MIILAGLSSYMLTERIGYENIVRKQMESLSKSGMIKEDQAEKLISESTTPAATLRGKIRGVVVPGIGILAIMLITSGLFKAFSAMMGAQNTFKQAFSVTAYSFLAVAIVSTLALAASIYLKDPSEIDMLNPVGSNLAAILGLIGVSLPKFVMGLATFIDIFSFWRLALLAIGFAAVSRKMAVGTAGIFVAVLYLIGALIGGAMSSLFG
jgi:hypothetical protein